MKKKPSHEVLIKALAVAFLLLPTVTLAAHRHAHAASRPPVVTTQAPNSNSSPSTGINSSVNPMSLNYSPQPLSTNPPVYGPRPVGQAAGGSVCINYGYQPLVNGQYDMTQVDNDLAYLKAHGILCVRLAFYGTDSAITKPVALAAKADGLYVIIGNDGDPTSPTYASGVIAEGVWAQNNHIDQMSIGNESDRAGANQAALASLSCKVRQVYSGVISYDTYKGSYDPIQAWAGNTGCLDKLGLNLYADYANTTKEAQSRLPNHWYISETDLDCDAGLCTNDASWASGLQNVLSIEQAYSVPIYVFSFNAGGDGVGMQWSISNHPQVASVIGLSPIGAEI